MCPAPRAPILGSAVVQINVEEVLRHAIRVPRRSPAAPVALPALVLSAAGGAAAAIPDSPGGEIHACYDAAPAAKHRSGAKLSIIDKAVNPEAAIATTPS